MLAGRQLAEHLLFVLGRVEAQTRQITFAGATGFDISELPIPAAKLKAYKTPRNLDELDLIVAHVTGVRSGFGVMKAAVQRWRKSLDAGLGAYPLLRAQLEVAGALDDLDDLARRLATWERYRETPYHQIGSQIGDVLANRDIGQVSWHGNGDAKQGGNVGVGFALDCHPAEMIGEWLVATGHASLKVLAGRVLKVSAKARRDGIRVAPHRAFSKDRGIDTDAVVWRKVILPVVERSGGLLRVDYEARWGSGRPVPNTWDDNALYDAKGRRIAA